MIPLLLSFVAGIMVGQPTPVYCYPPPGGWEGAVGITMYDPDTHIHLRYCRGTVRLNREDVDTFAHELLHVRHPTWTEQKVAAREHRYGARVLAVLREEEEQICP